MNKSKYEADEIHIVSEVVDGETVETRLPKEKAETLYRKLRAKGAKADIQKEKLIEDKTYESLLTYGFAKEEPYISPFEVEVQNAI